MITNGQRYLIVNADGFGRGPATNRGVMRGHEEGVLTSASLVVHGRDAREAAAYARRHPALSVGLHIDLGEWAYHERAWVPLYQRARVEDMAAVAAETLRQVLLFRDLVGRDPTHLDSHQHVHLRPPARWIIARMASDLGVPLRHVDRAVRHCGRFCDRPHNAVRVDAVRGMLADLPPGVIELACDPGNGHDRMPARDGTGDVDVLCDPRVRAAIEDFGIALTSFRDVGALSRAA